MANTRRYQKMDYRRCGRSGLLLPEVSLGIWHNWGLYSSFEEMKDMIFTAFDNGITHIDAANNYGPPPGAAEENLGRILADELRNYRDELIISTKAGHEMWPGPYGNWGSRKYLIASCDQSLKRMGLDYVDVFYHHRPDPDTPLEETMSALADLVKQGKALYVGFSRYPSDLLRKAVKILEEDYHIHPVLNQVRYNLLDRHTEDDGLYETLSDVGMSASIYSPLAQGLLTDKYLQGYVPEVSRAKENRFLKEEMLTETLVAKLNVLNDMALSKDMKLSEMALCCLLRRPEIATVIVGARNKEQLLRNIKALERSRSFTSDELEEIDTI